jgi:phosphate transport system permease protein
VHIWKTNSEGLVPDARQVADGSAAVLVLGVLLFNLLARYAGARVQKRMEGR